MVFLKVGRQGQGLNVATGNGSRRSDIGPRGTDHAIFFGMGENQLGGRLGGGRLDFKSGSIGTRWITGTAENWLECPTDLCSPRVVTEMQKCRNRITNGCA